MPIPTLNSDGLLPPGIIECTLAEIKASFARFMDSDQRRRLFVRLEELHNAMRRSGMFKALLIDGSFVTNKHLPNDIDLVAVLLSGHDFERDLPMSEYALVSRAMLRRRFGFDVMIAEEDSQLYETYIDFFSRVRDNPGVHKGILRVNL
jgi:hypothetical protein